MNPIAHIETAFREKFGIPRQSGLVPKLQAKIVFEPEYRNPEAFRGLEGYSHIWLLWQFSANKRSDGSWSATVKPPRLGGNRRMGVFATRSPYRPNPIGLSSVKLEKIEMDPEIGPVLYVSGADLLDQTPIYDIKPYLAYTDSHPDAKGGFADEVRDYRLQVVFPEAMQRQLPASYLESVIGVLEQDPRPAYIDDPTRRFGVAFGGYDIRFTVVDSVLTVVEVVKENPECM